MLLPTTYVIRGKGNVFTGVLFFWRGGGMQDLGSWSVLPRNVNGRLSYLCLLSGLRTLTYRQSHHFSDFVKMG